MTLLALSVNRLNLPLSFPLPREPVPGRARPNDLATLRRICCTVMSRSFLKECPASITRPGSTRCSCPLPHCRTRARCVPRVMARSIVCAQAFGCDLPARVVHDRHGCDPARTPSTCPHRRPGNVPGYARARRQRRRATAREEILQAAYDGTRTG